MMIKKDRIGSAPSPKEESAVDAHAEMQENEIVILDPDKEFDELVKSLGEGHIE
ncbi:hypothetical protein LJC60_07450 [Ruminococcaceae bacterium OttesenSCG-928-D13]|nr:hypothetical protein [Ruminococcaceae bacterium OttesenSCG-928-D13]